MMARNSWWVSSEFRGIPCESNPQLLTSFSIHRCAGELELRVHRPVVRYNVDRHVERHRNCWQVAIKAGDLSIENSFSPYAAIPMLSLKYQGKQRGPQYFFQVESSVNFLSKDLVVIAYSHYGAFENFSHVTHEQLSSFKYVVGSIFTSFTQPAYTMLATSFSIPEKPEDNVFQHRNITISLLRNTCTESDNVRGGNFVAIAHFHVEIEAEEKGSLSLEQKGSDPDVKECQFDTLTFEPLGGIVHLPVKRTKVRKYENCEPRLLKICQAEVLHSDDPYYFPMDVFDNDVVFVDLPGKA